MKFLILSLSLSFLLSFYLINAKAEETAPSVEYGEKLFTDPSLGTNGKSCSSCHNENALRRIASKDAWFAGEILRIEDAVNLCIKGALDGRPERRNSVKLKSIAMYIKTFKKTE